ncbi:MAG: glycosyltransferase [Ignavibacteriaceae bacterium]|nr:glycosyltransferase [Ignavibacteriaceae bacterium]
MYTGEFVFNESKCKAVLSAKINSNTLHPTEIEGLNARTFEIAGIGGFQIVNYRSELSNFFDDENELISFNNFDDLKEKIQFYIGNENLRNKIAKAGQERAYNEHTYKIRLRTLMEKVFSN